MKSSGDNVTSDPGDAQSEDKGKVFQSYPRRDRNEAHRVLDVLHKREFGVFRDIEDILPTEEWKDRLEQVIEEADTIVFLLSPNSVSSEVCAREGEYATSLNKRVAPFVIVEVDTAKTPPLLARLNFIFCRERDRFDDAMSNLDVFRHRSLYFPSFKGLANQFGFTGNASIGPSCIVVGFGPTFLPNIGSSQV